MKYRAGEEFVVTVDRKGLDPGEVIAHLADETMVVIVGAGSAIGERIEIVISDVLETSLGKTLMAFPKA